MGELVQIIPQPRLPHAERHPGLGYAPEEGSLRGMAQHVAAPLLGLDPIEIVTRVEQRANQYGRPASREQMHPPCEEIRLPSPRPGEDDPPDEGVGAAARLD